MNDNISFEQKLAQEFEKTIQLKQEAEAETNNFFEIAKLLGEDPKKDWEKAELPNYDLSGVDLQGANLREANLSSAKLIGANLRGADLSYADLSGVDFTKADLRDAIFDEVKAENAIFCESKGIYERIKIDLEDKGAIFRDLPRPESEDPNFRAYKQFLAKLLDDPQELIKYNGRFVAFKQGKLIAIANDQQDLLNQLDKLNEDSQILRIQVDPGNVDMKITYLPDIARRSKFTILR